jgi:hypothetical protein
MVCVRVLLADMQSSWRQDTLSSVLQTPSTNQKAAWRIEGLHVSTNENAERVDQRERSPSYAAEPAVGNATVHIIRAGSGPCAKKRSSPTRHALDNINTYIIRVSSGSCNKKKVSLHNTC